MGSSLQNKERKHMLKILNEADDLARNRDSLYKNPNKYRVLRSSIKPTNANAGLKDKPEENFSDYIMK